LYRLVLSQCCFCFAGHLARSSGDRGLGRCSPCNLMRPLQTLQSSRCCTCYRLQQSRSPQKYLKHYRRMLFLQKLSIYCKVEIKRVLSWCWLLALVLYNRSNSLSCRRGVCIEVPFKTISICCSRLRDLIPCWQVVRTGLYNTKTLLALHSELTRKL
jgi:hypothetical protein